MWEYVTVIFSSAWDTKNSIKQKSDEILNKYGSEGWELVNFQCAGAYASTMIFVFKRKIEK